jgi:NAD+ diphosphatase
MNALSRAWTEGACRIAPVCEGRVFLQWRDGVPRALVPTAAEAREMLAHAHSPAWLGDHAGLPVFAVSLRRFRPEHRIAGGDFEELRGIAAMVPDEDWELLARARALASWHDTHGFCSRCGQPTRPAADGGSRTCSADTCAYQVFPRTDPAVIMRVTIGDRILLGRQSAWPPRRRIS